jgi:hypothetical protein
MKREAELKYKSKKQNAVVQPYIVPVNGGSKGIVHIAYNEPSPLDFLDRNNKKGAVDTLEDEIFGSTTKYDGTLVVLVGHIPAKTHRLIHHYKRSTNLELNRCIIIFNGNKEEFKKVIKRSDYPKNLICDPIFISNYGWDMRMYGEAVLNYAFDDYFFINDDAKIKDPNWYPKYKEALEGHDLIGIQAIRFMRTTFYGCKRKLWLAIYCAVITSIVNLTCGRSGKRGRRIKVSGQCWAYAFEASNMWIAAKLGSKITTIQPGRAMTDGCRNGHKMQIPPDIEENLINNSCPRGYQKMTSDEDNGLLTYDYMLNVIKHRVTLKDDKHIERWRL